jgi:hypothetical protein
MSDDKVAYVDMGLNKILAEIEKARVASIHVGLVGEKAEQPTADGRLSVAEAGVISEYGSSDGKVPRRSFLRDPIHHEEALVIAELAQAAHDIALLRATSEVAYDKVGRRMALVVSAAIVDGVPPANAEATVEKKGFDEPLIDTGAMLEAVGHRVVRGSGDVLEGGSSAGEYESFETGTE